MKKKIVSIALVVAMIAIIAAGSFAYFTDTQKADNVFTVGNVNIELTEPNWDASGEVDGENAYAGEALKKDPTVTNTGNNPCFVRVKVEGLDCLGEDNMITYETNYKAGKLHDGWVLHTDGYFYWTKPLVVAEDVDQAKGLLNQTAPLFDQIRIPTTVTNGFDGNYDVIVTAEAVQAQGARPGWDKPEGNAMYPGVLQMSVEQIAAWFATCGMNK